MKQAALSQFFRAQKRTVDADADCAPAKRIEPEPPAAINPAPPPAVVEDAVVGDGATDSASAPATAAPPVVMVVEDEEDVVEIGVLRPPSPGSVAAGSGRAAGARRAPQSLRDAQVVEAERCIQAHVNSILVAVQTVRADASGGGPAAPVVDSVSVELERLASAMIHMRNAHTVRRRTAVEPKSGPSTPATPMSLLGGSSGGSAAAVPPPSPSPSPAIATSTPSIAGISSGTGNGCTGGGSGSSGGCVPTGSGLMPPPAPLPAQRAPSDVWSALTTPASTRPSSPVSVLPLPLTITSHLTGAAIMEEVIDRHPSVFSLPTGWRKARVCRDAIERLLAANPNTSGVSVRLQCSAEQRVYVTESGRAVHTRVPMEMLLRDLCEGRGLQKGGRFFPPAASRAPFTSDNACISWVSSILAPRIAATWSPPTPAAVTALYERGRSVGAHRWYDDAHALVLRACGGDGDEMRLFMGVLAACSPNSTVQQNVLNSLLNFRALSQHNRPRFGSYPNEMLLNYLGAALGVPSGAKVSAFLSNLTDPDRSVSVTIDTHMQQYLLGAGRQVLSAWQYAVLEDYLRSLARAVGEQPHRVQAALWCMAGPGQGSAAVSIKAELLGRALPVHTSLLPVDACLADSEQLRSVAAELAERLQHDAGARRAAVALLRRKLLDIGYMSLSAREDDRGPDAAAPPAAVAADLLLFLPLRPRDTDRRPLVLPTVASSVPPNAPPAMAVPPRPATPPPPPPTLLFSDEPMSVQLQAALCVPSTVAAPPPPPPPPVQSLTALLNGSAPDACSPAAPSASPAVRCGSDSVRAALADAHAEDVEWWLRDWRAVRSWLAQEAPHAPAPVRGADVPDPFYRTHQAFTGRGHDVLRELLPPSGFVRALAQQLGIRTPDRLRPLTPDSL